MDTSRIFWSNKKENNVRWFSIHRLKIHSVRASAKRNDQIFYLFNFSVGNDDWNCSAPHGAGRIMGRGVAKRTLNVEEFRETMSGIWSSCVSTNTLDESPMAYKDHSVIQDAIGDTIDIQLVVKPLYNFKASD